MYELARGTETPNDVYELNDPQAAELWDSLRRRRWAVEPEQTRLAMLCDRWDNLYYPFGVTKGGPSHWSDHESATLPGRSHVSINSYPSYVDIPASLTSVPPIENFVASVEETDEGAEAREASSMAERIYTTWKDTIGLEMKSHQLCVAKALYGRSAFKVWYDDDLDHPQVSIIDQPRNLRFGWASSDYTRLQWALYTYLITPDTAEEEYGLTVNQMRDPQTGEVYPYIQPVIAGGAYAGSYEHRAFVDTALSDLRLEVYDYWYRLPAEGANHELGKSMTFDTWHALFIGNSLVVRKRHPEYDGLLPYVPVFNSYVPGMPDGRSELFDIEQLVREKDERMSEAAQMMSRAINGQYWQLVGPEANDVPLGLRPIANQVVAPGPGNRIEAIAPWMPSFQVEQHIVRIDRELQDVSGQNDLIRGLAPPQVMNSGKAINALVSNYEARIRIKRDLYYEARRAVWTVAKTIWGNKQSDIADLLDAPYRHDIEPPTLTPRDDLETATMAANLVMAKLWSAKRGMDRVGVDDPEMEQEFIREEQTDATYNPASVMTLAQLLTVLKQLQMEPAAEAVDAASAAQQALASSRLLGGPTEATGESMQGEEEQPQVPPEQGPPPSDAELMGLEPAAPAAGGIEGDMLLQQQTPTGQAPRTRIVSQQRIIGEG